MKVTAIIQARMGSQRLPGKVLKKAYKDLTLIEVLLKRLSQSKLIDNIVIATSENKDNEPLIDLVKRLNLGEVGEELVDLLSPEKLLDILKNFSLFSTNKKKQRSKIICRFQQYEGANKIVERVVEGKEKKGLIWLIV